MEKITKNRFIELLSENDNVLYAVSTTTDDSTFIVDHASKVLSRKYEMPVRNHRKLKEHRSTYLLFSDDSRLMLRVKEPQAFYYLENEHGARFLMCLTGPGLNDYGDGYFYKIIIYALVWGGSDEREWKSVDIYDVDRRKELTKALRVNGITHEVSGCGSGWHFEILADEKETKAINDILEKENES